jgi:hypothetical protein
LLSVPVGTNLGLLHLLFALVSGRFLSCRGAVFPALADLGLAQAAVRRAAAALGYGRWCIADLLSDGRHAVLAEGVWKAPSYEGVRPVACDRVGFFRPCLRGCVGKHDKTPAEKALPALVFARVACVGSVGKQRLALPRFLLRQETTDPNEAGWQRRAIRQASQSLTEAEALIVDAGFPLADLLACGVARFVARVKKNITLRRNRLPVY